jgi:hypothetical protein
VFITAEELILRGVDVAAPRYPESVLPLAFPGPTGLSDGAVRIDQSVWGGKAYEYEKT